MHILRHCLTRRVAFAASLFAGLGLAGAAPAQTKLEARYIAALAGIPLGSGSLVIEVSGEQYTAVANGRTSGLVKLISDGTGSGGARGMLRGSALVPMSYASNSTSDKKADEVRMTLRNGAVKEVYAEPPLEKSPDRVPVTEAHRNGVIDPMTAPSRPFPGPATP